jgi:hypothetical protein
MGSLDGLWLNVSTRNENLNIKRYGLNSWSFGYLANEFLEPFYSARSMQSSMR